MDENDILNKINQYIIKIPKPETLNNKLIILNIESSIVLLKEFGVSVDNRDIDNFRKIENLIAETLNIDAKISRHCNGMYLIDKTYFDFSHQNSIKVDGDYAPYLRWRYKI